MAKRAAPKNVIDQFRGKVSQLAAELHALPPKQKQEFQRHHRAGEIEPLLIPGKKLSSSELSKLKAFIKKLDAPLARTPDYDPNDGALERAETTLRLIERFVPERLDAAQKDLKRGRTLLSKSKKKSAKRGK